MLRLISKKKNNNMNFIRKVWILMAPFHKDLYILTIVTTFMELFLLSGVFIYGRILDLLTASGGLINLKTALMVVGGLATARLLTMILDYLADVLIVKLLWKSERYLQTQAYEKLLELSIDYHEKINTGTKINIVNKGTDKLVELIGAFTWEFQPIVVKIILSAILALLTSWIFGVAFLLSVVPFIYLMFLTYQKTAKLRSKRHDLYEKSSGEIGDTISNITVVKAFAQENREKNSFQNLWELVLSISGSEYKTHILEGFYRSLMTEGFYILMVSIGIWQIYIGNLTVGTLVFLISILERTNSNIFRLGRIYERAVDASEPVERISSLLSQKSSVKEAENPISLENFQGNLAFRHVTFAYKNRRVLKNVSFTIPAGSFTALVGKSGSGKSTIAKLLSRYYDPNKGSIVLDGKYDLRQVKLDDYHQQTSVVFQDSPVPNRKIWEVIAYSFGRSSFASVRNRVIRAAELAHAHEFITEFEDGYNTEIGEKGVKLSGGQKQRLAIARALFAEPKILIMDEPTSHLDTLSEAMIQKALEDISKEKTLTKIVIAHRLSTVQKADQILVMDKGKIAEKGTHTELLKQKGIYASIVAQSELKP
jgi:ABC-type multidrug transport system fused ATPase/permease subunit